eukprot:110731-Chlamydomonas_euryale.AAC.1
MLTKRPQSDARQHHFAAFRDVWNGDLPAHLEVTSRSLVGEPIPRQVGQHATQVAWRQSLQPARPNGKRSGLIGRAAKGKKGKKGKKRRGQHAARIAFRQALQPALPAVEEKSVD